MIIHATITIDDDRWAKHPFGVEFDDPECNSKFHRNWLDDREECYKVIASAQKAGYDIDSHIEETFY